MKGKIEVGPNFQPSRRHPATIVLYDSKGKQIIRKPTLGFREPDKKK